MSISAIETKNAPAAIGPYSQAVITGGMIYTAGQIALDPATGKLTGDDIETQTRRVLDNLAAVLKEAGATFNSVVKTTIYVTDLTHFAKVNQIYAEKLGEARPARSTVQVAALPLGALVEMDMIATILEEEQVW